MTQLKSNNDRIEVWDNWTETDNTCIFRAKSKIYFTTDLKLVSISGNTNEVLTFVGFENATRWQFDLTFEKQKEFIYKFLSFEFVENEIWLVYILIRK